LPASVRLPWRERLMAEGTEFTNYYTHSSPCSPSRASMLTGRYLPQHRVVDNVIMPEHVELDPAIPTVGSMLRDAGYRSSYIGKWHLSHATAPDMPAYGFSDWEGNDRHFMGWAGTGVHFDPIIAANAAAWLRTNATTLDQPWFLTVALVNPHDVMWFPIDQPWYGDSHPDDVARARKVLEHAQWKEDDVLPLFSDHYDEVCEDLPPNFGDDLLDKPEAQRQWRWDQQHGLWGYIDPADKKRWLRHLDYYVKLQQMADLSLGTVMAALEAAQVPVKDVLQDAVLRDRALDALIVELEKRKVGAGSRRQPNLGTGTRVRSRPGLSLRPRPPARDRYIPAQVRRAVWERDQGQCTFVSSVGHRCESRRFLEFDHIDPVARGGRATVEGMRLRCRAHNQYEAERTFGAGFMSRKRHEARRAAERAPPRVAA
jgi:5-methylcytosine-specific restriction endonuclease McrA